MDELFLLGLAGILVALFVFGFRKLPQDRWQMIASIPVQREASGLWRGVNLTFYGFFNATALVMAISVWSLLLSALGLGGGEMAALGVPLIGICFLASRGVARWVEKKRHTATIGGASFVLILISPWLIAVIEGFHLSGTVPFSRVFPILSTVLIAYALGEGVGRLACISFGCCYGKPLDQCHPWLRRLFSHFPFVFSGETKKISYAHGWEGRPVVPIQGLTAILSTGAALVGIYLFLKGRYGAAFWIPLVATQLWRFFSEFLRADFRGEGKITAYQWMALLSIPYALSLAAWIPLPSPLPTDLRAGLEFLSKPVNILFLQGLWIVAFFLTGKSSVTASTLSFHVIREKT